MSNRPQHAESSAPTRPSKQTAEGHWEWWTRAAIGLTVLAFVTWMYVLFGSGIWSVAAHSYLVPILGAFTLPVTFWGVVKTVFNPPLLRRRRIVGFALLIATAVFCTVPMFPAPVSTGGWTSEHAYRLPFEGEWYTTAGGPHLERNYHAVASWSRWAYDFTVRKDGSRHSGDGESLEDYYCFGRPVLAPVGGKVIRLEGSLKDAPPGEHDETSTLGNHLVIEVGPREYLFLATLKKNSLDVEVGDVVSPGQKVAECGNSGRTFLPHVHVHLQNRARFPLAEGLPLRFTEYRADGEIVSRGMPLGAGEGGTPEGQRVAPVDGSEAR